MTVVINPTTTVDIATSILQKQQRKQTNSDEKDTTTSSSMKLKSLSKKVAKKIIKEETEDFTEEKKKIIIERIKKTLQEREDVFVLQSDNKYVALVGASKSKSSSTVSSPSLPVTIENDEDTDEKEDEEKEEETKKSKKDSKKRVAEDKKDKKKKKRKKDKSSSNTETSTADWRKQHKIIVIEPQDAKNESSSSSLDPFMSFDSCQGSIDARLLQHCTQTHKFKTPSPIQAQCWPILLSQDKLHKKAAAHRDVIGIAETGSGKTLAFALPALSTMIQQTQPTNQNSKKGRSPRMLVLAPTRELAMQSHAVLSDFGSTIHLTSLVVYGGVPKHTQTRALSQGVDCIVATPGRLKDLLHDGSCDLSNVQHLVLDEADRMLDLGFEEDVRYIVGECPAKEARTTAMFSATWPASVQELSGVYTVHPVKVYVGFDCLPTTSSNGSKEGDGSKNGVMVDDSLSANKRVAQNIEVLEDRARENRLVELLRQYSQTHSKKNRSNTTTNDLILVFALYKKEAQRLEYTLQRRGFPCASIHGDKTQEARTRALAEFKNGSTKILIATDVASRGLDIPNVGVVINYTFPLTIEDYVHRIGRTGRAGRTGTSFTFFQPSDKAQAGALQAVMRQAGQEDQIPAALSAFGNTIKKKEHGLYGNFGPKSGMDGVPMKKAVKIKFSYSDDEE